MAKASLILIALVAALLQSSHGFQFMSKWKLPTPVDVAQEAAVQEKFGDKSTYLLVGAGTCVFLI